MYIPIGDQSKSVQLLTTVFESNPLIGSIIYIISSDNTANNSLHPIFSTSLSLLSLSISLFFSLLLL
jgi:hypothetical protein